MQLLATILPTLLAGILVLLVPGAGLLAVMRLDRIVPPPLVPAAALALGLAPLFLVTAATLALRLSIAWVAIAMALVALLSWSTLAARHRAEHRPGRAATMSTRTRARASAWAAPLHDLVAGAWLRGTPWPAVAAALAGGVVALLMGFHAWNDSLYHIGQAQKLLALDAPSFSNTLQFEDGSAHPGYLVPAWQEAVALVSFVARVDPVVAAWVMPAITVPVSLLAVGGLAWSLTRARLASVAGSIAALVLVVAALPYSDAFVNALHPGSIALGVLAPLVLALLLVALWPERTDGGVGPQLATRGATLLAIVAVAEVGLLHVGYLWVLGMGILGYVAAWLLRGPWPREVVLRHLRVGASIAVVAVACLALLLPGLNRLESVGLDAAAELERNQSEQYVGENAANLDALLRGDPEGAFHLRADWLVLAGGLALAGLLAIPLTLLAPRWPGGWYLSGAATIVLGIALTDTIFPRFVELVTLDQARRIERVLPLGSGLAMGALAVGAAATVLWRRGAVAARAVAAALTLGAALGLALLTHRVEPLVSYGGGTIVAPRVIVAVLVALLVGAAAAAVGLVARALRRRGRSTATVPPLPDWTWPTEWIGAPAALVAAAVLLAGAVPAYDRLGTVVDDARLEGVPADMRTAELRLFAPNVARELRRLPTGATVLADPRTRDPYMAMALAPVYVVSSVPRHTALTPENRVGERFELATSFFRDELSLAERRQLLLDERVDAVVVHPFGAAEAQRQLAAMPGVRVGIIGTLQKIWLVDRAQLARSRPA